MIEKMTLFIFSSTWFRSWMPEYPSTTTTTSGNVVGRRRKIAEIAGGTEIDGEMTGTEEGERRGGAGGDFRALFRIL